MKVYQEKQETVNTGIKITDYEFIQEKARDGLLRLSVSLGIEVMRLMFGEDVTLYAGPRDKHGIPERTGYQNGHGQITVVLGGEKIHTKRPRVRSINGDEELPLPSLAPSQTEDPLNEAIIAILLAGVSTGKYCRTIEGQDGICTSKSEVNHRFIQQTDKLMEEFSTRPLNGDYLVVIIDGAVVIELFNDLIERGLDPLRPRLYMLDGSKALYKGVTDVFGKEALIQRCQVHKKRNVLSHLPQSEQANVSKNLSMVYREFDYKTAKDKLLLLASNLEYRYPRAAASLREGLEETLTVYRLNVPGLLRETLSNTNPLESANSVCRGLIRRVCNFKDGGMALRHAAAGFMRAEQGFRRIKGYKHMNVLAAMLEGQTFSQAVTNMA